MNMRMKKIIGFVLALVMVMGAMPMGTIKAYAAEGDVAINETNFPDANFREYIKKFDTDGNGTLSRDERNKVEEIIVVKKRIKSLKGIEHFPELWRIKCEENKLSELDVSRNKNLVSLNCGDNKLGSLDISKNTALTALYCSNNQLTELDVSNNPNLDILKCYMNKLSKLDVQKNPKLTDLYCNFNQLKELDVSKNLALKEFKCNKNQIEKLNVSNNKELTLLDCSNNKLENLDVKANTKLEKLWCSDNNLTKLDVSENTALLHLDCGTNKLKALDVSRCPEIDTLMCYVNELKKLDVSMNKKLEWLSCFNNQLTELDVSKNSELAKFNANNNPLTSVKLGSNDYTEKSLNPFYSIEVPKGVSEIKFPKGFDTSKIEGPIKGISINGDSLEWDEKTEKAEFKYKLCDKPEEIVTIKVEFDKKDNPDLEAAKGLVQTAENNKTEENYKIANEKVEKLLKGSGKTGLENRLKEVKNFLLGELNKEKDKAKEDINGLNLTPDEKTAVEKAIDEAKTKAAVEKAVEEAKEQAKTNDANDLANAKKKAKDDINGLNLKPEEKTAAEKAIDEAKTKAAVEKAVEDAKEKAKTNDAADLANAKDKAKDTIDKLLNLSKDEKDSFNNQVKEKTTKEDVEKVVTAAEAKDAENKKAIDQMNKERIKVGVNSLTVGAKTLEIRTSVPRATVVIKIGGVEIGTITTDAYGTFSQGLPEGLKADQEVILEASKPNYNDGSYSETVY